MTRWRHPSPLGLLALESDGAALVSLRFVDDEGELAQWAEASDAATRSIAAQLDAYFAGTLAALDEIACTPAGTAFQQRVWSALRAIRPGSTLAYGELAAQLGDPLSVRAVGAANGANPIAVVIPCHRVIAADGSLHGYGGGLDRKRWLLEHEGALTRRLPGM